MPTILEITTPTTTTNVTLSTGARGPAGSGGGTGEWGDIEGDLSDQTDLQAVLDGKADNYGPALIAITGNTTIDATHMGKLLVMGSDYTLTIPDASGFAGRSFMVSTEGGEATLAGATVQKFTSFDSITLLDNTNAYWIVECVAGGWLARPGSPNLAGYSQIGHTHPLSDVSITGATDIGEALADDDLIPVHNLSGTANRKSALSRFLTWVESKASATFSSGKILLWGSTADNTLSNLGGGAAGVPIFKAASVAAVKAELKEQTKSSSGTTSVSDATTFVDASGLTGFSLDAGGIYEIVFYSSNITCPVTGLRIRFLSSVDLLSSGNANGIYVRNPGNSVIPALASTTNDDILLAAESAANTNAAVFAHVCIRVGASSGTGKVQIRNNAAGTGTFDLSDAVCVLRKLNY